MGSCRREEIRCVGILCRLGRKINRFRIVWESDSRVRLLSLGRGCGEVGYSRKAG